MNALYSVNWGRCLLWATLIMTLIVACFLFSGCAPVVQCVPDSHFLSCGDK